MNQRNNFSAMKYFLNRKLIMFYIYLGCGSRLFTKKIEKPPNHEQGARLIFKQSQSQKMIANSLFWSFFIFLDSKKNLSTELGVTGVHPVRALNPQMVDGFQNPANILFSKQRISLLIRMGVFGRLFFSKTTKLWLLIVKSGIQKFLGLYISS